MVGSEKASRSFAASHIVLELDGRVAGTVAAVEGGHVQTPIIPHVVGLRRDAVRVPGRQKFEDLTMQVGMSMAASFWRWMKRSIDGFPERCSGALVIFDFDGRERSRRTFHDALISEVQFPQLDASVRAPAVLTVKIAPEVVIWESNGSAGFSERSSARTKQKLWVPANFQLRIDGLEAQATRQVSKVEPITIRQQIIACPLGEDPWVRKEPGRIEYPTLAVHVREVAAKGWLEWWKKFVTFGQRSSDQKRTGSLVFLASDCVTPLLTLTFGEIGIVGVTFPKYDAGADELQTIKVSLSIERMTLQAGQGSER